MPQYTQKIIDFMLAHYNVDMTPQQVADKLGYTKAIVNKAAINLRRLGYKIAHNEAPDGTVSFRKGGKEKYIKQGGIWVYQKSHKPKTGRAKSPDEVGTIKTYYYKHRLVVKEMTPLGWRYVRSSMYGADMKMDLPREHQRLETAKTREKRVKVTKISKPVKEAKQPIQESRKPAREVVTRTNENKKAPLYTNSNPKTVKIRNNAERIAEQIEQGYKFVWVTPESGRPYRALRAPGKIAS